MASLPSSSRPSPGRQTRARFAARAVALLAAGAALQAQAAPAQQPQPPQFRGRTDTVQVDVTVLDKDGRPVTNLTLADFEVREGGTIQSVSTIALMTANPALAPPPAPGAPPVLPADTPAGVPVRRLPPRLFVFVLDIAHLSPNGFDRTRTALRSFLSDGLRPGDFAGIVVNGSMIGDKIITDKATLLDQLSGIKLPAMSRYSEMRQWPKVIDEEEANRIAVRRLQPALDAAVQRACTEHPADCAGPGGRGFVEGLIESKAAKFAGESAADAQNALAMLKTLASGLGRFPGPKHVLLFSEGFYTGEFSDRVTDLSGLASQNNVRISTLDARGLATDARMDNLLGESPLLSTSDQIVLGHDVNADVLTTLALETGGERVKNRNILRPSLDRLADITGTYYLLGYSPTTPFDGKYRSIDVKVRRPGVTVVARRGYLAVRRPPTAEEEREAAVLAGVPPPMATSSRLPATAGIPAVLAPPDPERIRMEETRTRSDVNTRLTSGGGAASAGALAREGWKLYGEGNIEAARDKLAAASAAGGGVWADYALGLAEFALNNPAAAAPLFERVRKAEPAYEPIYFDLADAYSRLGERTEAIKVMRDAAQRWPKDADTHNALGVFLIRADIDGAIDAFRRAVAVAPNEADGWWNLGFALDRRNRERNASRRPVLQRVGELDRDNAIEAYRKYLEIGGPYDDLARQALAALGWRK